MKILISGSHGLVGRALGELLIKDGHEVFSLVRRARTVGAPEIEWHPEQVSTRFPRSCPGPGAWGS